MADEKSTFPCPESMKVVELKYYLKSKGVKADGKKKAELIAR